MAFSLQAGFSFLVFAEDVVLFSPIGNSGQSLRNALPAQAPQSSTGETTATNPSNTYKIPSSTLRHRRALMNTSQAMEVFKKAETQNIIVNLFPNAEFKAQVKSVRATQFGGSFISADLNGSNSGYMTLTIGKNGSIRGEVHSSRGVYTIRNSGSAPTSESQPVLIQEVDISQMPQGNDVINLPIESVEQIFKKKSLSNQKVFSSVSFEDSEDEDIIDVLVLYTAHARQAEGGKQAIETTIENEITKTNTALSSSGVTQGRQVRLIHAEEVNYTKDNDDMGVDLRKLVLKRGSRPDTEGELDSIHKLRDQYAADLVHLFVAEQSNACGVAFAWDSSIIASVLEGVSSVDLSRSFYRDLKSNAHDWSQVVDSNNNSVIDRLWKRSYSFSVSAISRCPLTYTFSHELGHSMGLHHDRYAEYHDESGDSEDQGYPLYPYGYGYVNQNFDRSSCWRTIMAYGEQCVDEGFSNSNLGLTTGFSNPNRRFPTRDSAGQPGENFTTDITGPVNAVQAINQSWSNLAKLMPSENSCSQALSVSKGSEKIASAGSSNTVEITVSEDGENFSLDLSPDYCDSRQVSSNSFHPFISVSRVSDRSIGVRVNANSRCSDRQGDFRLTAWNNNFRFRIRQGAGTRSLINREISGQCSSASDAQLAGTTDLDLENKSITSLSGDDFQGLTALRDLNLENNRLSELESQVFSSLSNLEELNVSKNRIGTISNAAFSGLNRLRSLDLADNLLLSLSSDVFSGLSRLKYLWLSKNRLGSLSSEIFSETPQLRILSLDQNNLRSLPTDLFSGLSRLRYLWLSDNDLTTLPSGIFSGLSGLKYLSLSHNNFSGSLPSGVCTFLRNVDYLVLSVNLNTLCSSSSSAAGTIQEGVIGSGTGFEKDLNSGSVSFDANKNPSSEFFQSHFVFSQNNTYHYVKKEGAGNPLLEEAIIHFFGADQINKKSSRILAGQFLGNRSIVSENLSHEERKIIIKMQEDGVPFEFISHLTQQPLSVIEQTVMNHHR